MLLGRFFDLDYIIITSGDGDEKWVCYFVLRQPDDELTNRRSCRTEFLDTTLDDFNSITSYSSGWITSPNGLQKNYYMQTMQ